MADITLDVAVTLPLVQVTGSVQPVTSDVSVGVVIPFLTVAAELGPFTGHTLTASITLPKVQASLVVQEPTETANIAVVLPRVAGHVQIRSNAKIYNLTGTGRAQGSILLAFVGPPDASLVWDVTEGDGTLYPLSLFTDTLGRAYCRFDPGDYTGPVTITVAYVS